MKLTDRQIELRKLFRQQTVSLWNTPAPLLIVIKRIAFELDGHIQVKGDYDYIDKLVLELEEIPSIGCLGLVGKATVAYY